MGVVTLVRWICFWLDEYRFVRGKVAGVGVGGRSRAFLGATGVHWESPGYAGWRKNVAPKTFPNVAKKRSRMSQNGSRKMPRGARESVHEEFFKDSLTAMAREPVRVSSKNLQG